MPAPQAFQFGFQAMGSPCELQLHAPDPLYAHGVARAVRAELERLEQKYSRYRADSYLAQINRVAAAGGELKVDAETASLLDYAETCYTQSDGLFDVTSGLLRRAWRFREGRLPEPGSVAALLAHIGWQRLEWRRPVLRMPAGMELDFGGIVKEFAADRVAALCEQAGCAHGFVNLGGDLRVLGPRPDGTPWQIAIRDPRTRGAGVLLTLPILRGGVATSGDYERCIEIDGRRYGHVLNPRTGWPVQHLASVTVQADFCVLAGSAATIALLREQAGAAWLSELGLPHLWVDTAGRSGGTLAPAR